MSIVFSTLIWRIYFLLNQGIWNLGKCRRTYLAPPQKRFGRRNPLEWPHKIPTNEKGIIHHTVYSLVVPFVPFVLSLLLQNKRKIKGTTEKKIRTEAYHYGVSSSSSSFSFWSQWVNSTCHRRSKWYLVDQHF